MCAQFNSGATIKRSGTKEMVRRSEKKKFKRSAVKLQSLRNKSNILDKSCKYDRASYTFCNKVKPDFGYFAGGTVV